MPANKRELVLTTWCNVRYPKKEFDRMKIAARYRGHGSVSEYIRRVMHGATQRALKRLKQE